MSSVDFARIFLLFIELQISDIASNIDARPDRRVWAETAAALILSKENRLPGVHFSWPCPTDQHDKENKNRPWDLKFCVINLFGVWNL